MLTGLWLRNHVGLVAGFYRSSLFNRPRGVDSVHCGDYVEVGDKVES